MTREEADLELQRGMGTALRKAVFGPLEPLVDFYIPFHFFQVSAERAGHIEARVFGADAVTGKLDPYEFESLPGAEDTVYVETRHCPPVLLDEARAQELLRGKLRRVSSPIRAREIALQAIAGEIYIPYWVGFYGRGTGSRFAVIDAMRCRREGAKVRQLLREWMESVTVKS